MPDFEPIIRQETLPGLPQFCLGLAEALKRIVPDDARRKTLVRTSLAGECVLCGLSVNGEELLEVGTSEGAAEAANPKIARLRQGYCARNGCDSRFYRLIFYHHPELDWTQAFTQSAVVQEEQQEETQAELAEAKALRRAQRWKLAGRVGSGLVVLCVLYLLRQWYTGGTIPILREPEHFQVDPASLQQRPPQ
jgi:hypothetical protein